jgi:hypothetical protein
MTAGGVIDRSISVERDAVNSVMTDDQRHAYGLGRRDPCASGFRLAG